MSDVTERDPATAHASPEQAVRAFATSGPILPILLKFAIPAMAANLLQSASQTINAIWIGRLLGPEALAAAANVGALTFFLLSLALGLGVAASIMVGQSIGAGRGERVKQVSGTSISSFVAAGLLAAFIGVTLDHPVLHAMNTPGQVMPLATAYLSPIFLALPAMCGLTALMMLMRGMGDARTIFWFMLMQAVLDAGLNPVLIRGLGPVPAFGIAGSAYATLVANTVTVVALVTWLYRTGNPLRLVGAELRFLIPDGAILRQLVTKGVPIGLQMIVASSSLIVMVSFVDRYGSAMVAAYGACFQLWNYVQVPAFAVGMAVSSMAAQNVGAGQWDRVGRITLAGFVANILLTSSLVGVIALLKRSAFALFLGDDHVAITDAIHINSIAAWSFVIFGGAIVLSSSVRSAGAVVAPLLILFVALWIVRLPVAWLAMPRFGADALFWSFPLGAIVSLVLSAVYYRWGGWRRAMMIAPEA